jgi:hypothetical protein
MWFTGRRFEDSISAFAFGPSLPVAEALRRLTGTLPGGEPGGVYQVYGADSGAYEASLTTAVGATTLDIYLDSKLSGTARASQPSHAGRSDRGVGGGLRGYQIGSTYQHGAIRRQNSDRPGRRWPGHGGCLSIRSGRRFSGCLGLEHQSRPGEDMSVDWYFIEPRFAAFQSQEHTRWRPASRCDWRRAPGEPPSRSIRQCLLPACTSHTICTTVQRARIESPGLGYYAWLGNTNTTGDKPTTFRVAAGVNWHLTPLPTGT